MVPLTTERVDMNKPILSAAIVLPLVIASAASSFANDAAKLSPTIRNSAITNTVQPIVSQPLIQDGLVNGSLTSGGETIKPGEGVRVPGRGPGPRPPKFPGPDELQNVNINTVNPIFNSIPQSPNIENVAPGY